LWCTPLSNVPLGNVQLCVGTPWRIVAAELTIAERCLSDFTVTVYSA
jgi:hypothetical protein